MTIENMGAARPEVNTNPSPYARNGAKLVAPVIENDGNF
jgi:hypothetical protein